MRASCSKNSLTGKLRQAEFPVYYDYGLDDLAGCLEFLKTRGGLDDFKRTHGLAGEIGKLLQAVEDRGLEEELRRAVAEKWTEIEEALQQNRKRRYE